MAIKLENKPNVTPPGGAYPYGNIKDDTGVGDGTPVDTIVYADLHQFFARLADQAGITLNNLPDNATNGFQYFLALAKIVANGFPNEPSGAWINAGPPIITPDTGTASFFGSTYNRYKIIGKTFFWQLYGATTFSGSPTVLNIPFPVALAKASPLDIYITGTFGPTSGTVPLPLSVKISASGAQVVRNPQAAFNFASGYPIMFQIAFEIA